MLVLLLHLQTLTSVPLTNTTVIINASTQWDLSDAHVQMASRRWVLSVLVCMLEPYVHLVQICESWVGIKDCS